MRGLTINKKEVDYIVLGIIIALTIFGLLALSSASLHLGNNNFEDSYYYLRHQLLYGLLPGIIGFIIAYRIQCESYRKIALPLIIGNMALLFLIFTPLGVTLGGAGRWITIGGLTFQPGEFLKISLVIYLAAWLSGNQ